MEAAKAIYDKINDSLKENFNMNFNEAMDGESPTLNLELKNSKAAAKEQRRKLAMNRKI